MDCLFATHLKALADLSYQTEEKRGKKLETQCGRLLTCITILSVALLTPAPTLFGFFGDGTFIPTCKQITLGWMYLIVLAQLAAALLVLLTTLILKRMPLLQSPMKQAEFIENELTRLGEDPSIGELNITKNYCQALEPTFIGLREKHSSMSCRLKIATCLLFSSCIFTLFFGVCLLIFICLI